MLEYVCVHYQECQGIPNVVGYKYCPTVRTYNNFQYKSGYPFFSYLMHKDVLRGVSPANQIRQ